MIAPWLSEVLEFVYPGICAVCGMRGERGRDLCGQCRADLPTIGYRCQQCALPLLSPIASICGRCLRKPPAFDRAFIPYLYEIPITRLIAGLKFHEHLHLARLLGLMLSEFLGTQGNLQVDCIMPIPLHPKRMRERGFNHAQLVAQIVSRTLKLPLDLRSLERSVHRSPQLELPARERRKNVRGVFRARPDRVEGKRIALLDDVVTTGSTVDAAARELKAKGASEVIVLAVARTS